MITVDQSNQCLSSHGSLSVDYRVAVGLFCRSFSELILIFFSCFFGVGWLHLDLRRVGFWVFRFRRFLLDSVSLKIMIVIDDFRSDFQGRLRYVLR